MWVGSLPCAIVMVSVRAMKEGLTICSAQPPPAVNCQCIACSLASTCALLPCAQHAQSLVVLAAVLGMLNMAPASLHHELHSRHSSQELRQQTGAGWAGPRRPLVQLPQGPDWLWTGFE